MEGLGVVPSGKFSFAAERGSDRSSVEKWNHEASSYKVF